MPDPQDLDGLLIERKPPNRQPIKEDAEEGSIPDPAMIGMDSVSTGNCAFDGARVLYMKPFDIYLMSAVGSQENVGKRTFTKGSKTPLSRGKISTYSPVDIMDISLWL